MLKYFLTSKKLVSPNGQSADFVELFFDLVFVYAITRLTAITAQDFSAITTLKSVIIFWIIWWAWTQFTWTLNAANTKQKEVRLMVLIATGVAFVMASSVDLAFKEGAIWFAATYVIVRLVGITLHIRVTPQEEGNRKGIIRFALFSLTGLTAVIIGAFVAPEFRHYVWLGAIGLDFFSSLVGAQEESWKLNPNHFSERHSLILIIALGESLIVAASAVSGQERSHDLMMAGGFAVVITCLLWWSYFSWISEFLEKKFPSKTGATQGQYARDTYSLLHFFVICGIIGIAVAFEKIMHHPHDLLTEKVAYALGGGYALYLGFSGLSVLRASGLFLKFRFIVLGLTLIGLIFSVGQPPIMGLGIITLSLFLINAKEWKRCNAGSGHEMSH